MKGIIGVRQMMLRGRELESVDRFQEAAAVYQSLFDRDSSNPDVVDRLLIVYRKLKEYRKELDVIDRTLAAFQERDKTAQQQWLTAHPKAAAAGKAVLRNLGGRQYSAFGADPIVNRLQKRKEIVEKKLGIGKTKHKVKGADAGSGGKKKPVEQRVAAATQRGAIAQARKKDAKAKQAEADRKRQQARERKEAGIAARKKAADIRKAKTEERKADVAASKKKAALNKNRYPSLFVIDLRYLVSLEQIDAEISRHAAFLDKFYKSGHILMSGRQVPRTGGIIIAKGKNRNAVLNMMKEDPLVRKKMASIDVIEFSASRVEMAGIGG
jgi:uncharacterized protein YciI